MTATLALPDPGGTVQKIAVALFAGTLDTLHDRVVLVAAQLKMNATDGAAQFCMPAALMAANAPWQKKKHESCFQSELTRSCS